MIRKYLLPLLAIVGLGVAILMVIRGNRTPQVAQPAGQSAKAPFTSYIFGPGIVEASTENIAVGTPISGIVTEIYVKLDEPVKIGNPLFKIDTSDLQAQLLLANAKVKEVEAQLLPAAAKVNEAEATLAKAENRLKVGEGLESGVSISVEEMANRRFDIGINKANLASTEAQVEQIKAQVASAEAQVEQIKTEIDRRTIRALKPGRILQIKTRPGEFAQSGVLSTPLMLLGDVTQLHVRVDVDENDAWRVQPCASAVASVRGNPDLNTPVQFVRTEPDVIPKVSLTSDSTQRTDTRVLQVIYSFDRASLPVYVGQQMDVFIEEPLVGETTTQAQSDPGPCRDEALRNADGRTPRRRKH